MQNTNPGDEIEFLPVDRAVTFFEGERNEVESEIASSKIRDIETSLWVRCAANLNRSRCSSSGCIEGRAFFNSKDKPQTAGVCKQTDGETEK